VPYGDHAPWTQTHEDNGKCGMAAVMFNFLGEKNGAEFFSRMSVASHGPERDTGHTGNFTNILWAMPGVAQAGPQATGAWMQEFGAWYFDLARTWDGELPPPGPAGAERRQLRRLGCHRRLPARLCHAAQENPAHRQTTQPRPAIDAATAQA
jgi:hypothetical protein